MGKMHDRSFSKFCKARELVLKICTVISADMNECLQLPVYRSSARCGKGSLCLHDAPSSLVDVYAKFEKNFCLSADSMTLKIIISNLLSVPEVIPLQMNADKNIYKIRMLVVRL